MGEEFFSSGKAIFRRNPRRISRKINAVWRKKARSGGVNSVIEQV
jgi:hypothetical protein